MAPVELMINDKQALCDTGGDGKINKKIWGQFDHQQTFTRSIFVLQLPGTIANCFVLSPAPLKMGDCLFSCVYCWAFF